MFPKKQKITRKEFLGSINNAARYNSNHLSLLVSHKKNIQQGKFSFVVSGKVVKKANTRNRLRRRGYYVLKKFGVSSKSGLLAVFFLKKGVGELSYKDFEKEILQILQKSHIL